ncbi:MAG: hypothetical protein LC122_04390 [Chitinophagales bacterium]|nr:hypothetical protein [Chitinophagales bacterium]
MIIFIIDFSNSTFLVNKISRKNKVFFEGKDGELAYKKIGEILPDKIFINYNSKPSHCRQTAQAILKRKKTAHIPIYFIGNPHNDIEKVKHFGKVISIEEIENYLS